MNLYWVDNAIYKLYDEFVDPETGELTDPDAFAERYAELEISREEIIENTLLLYKNCVSDAEAIAAEIKTLKARQAALEKRADRLKADASDALNGEKFQTAKVAVSWRKSTAAEVDESLCPVEYITTKVTTAPDKKAITAALKAGQEIPGCKLVERVNMSVR
jgi:hypothetical protein|nr:MAG TPA: resistance protein [Caudoviricetes sp.]